MAILEVENLCKNFGKTEVLKGVNFTMEKGEVVAIIGSSGNGKTTLLRCLNSLETPDSGRITVGGNIVFDAEDAKNNTRVDDIQRESRLKMGMIFQNFNLFPQYTALENVMLAMKLLENDNLKTFPNGVEKTAKDILSRVGLDDKFDSCPFELSGGQQQRVAIARALALSPEILCFDEPTSALDPELTGEVLNVMRKLANEGMTMIVVTHEIQFAKNVADRIIFMADGIILEEGTPEEVIDNPKCDKTISFLKKINEK